jgi:hypothetical protein
LALPGETFMKKTTKKKVRLTILMLVGVLAYFASEKPSAAGWCNEICDNIGPNGEFCCVAPDCSLVCY